MKNVEFQFKDCRLGKFLMPVLLTQILIAITIVHTKFQELRPFHFFSFYCSWVITSAVVAGVNLGFLFLF